MRQSRASNCSPMVACQPTHYYCCIWTLASSNPNSISPSPTFLYVFLLTYTSCLLQGKEGKEKETLGLILM